MATKLDDNGDEKKKCIYISSKTTAPELSKIRAESVIKSRERKG